MADTLEHKAEQQFSIILKTEAEFWETRNKAILALTNLISQYDGIMMDTHNITDHFNANFYRSLKEPLKSMVRTRR